MIHPFLSLDSSVEPSSVSVTVNGECRICHEEDTVACLDTPCSCSGTLKYVHRNCAQLWCNAKGDAVCEICHQPFKGGYASPVKTIQSATIRIEPGGNWRITGPHRLDLHNSHVLAIGAEQHLLHINDNDRELYPPASNANGPFCCFSAALILLSLLLLQRAVSTLTSVATEENIATSFPLFLLRAVGFLLLCYLTSLSINILKCYRR